jgi:cytochrome c-type biogenesis protein CcmH
MKTFLAATLLTLVCCSPFFGAAAMDQAPAFEDPVQQERYQRLARELRCLKCRSESLMDSNIQVAADLRRQLRELIAAGKTDEEIFTYMSDRYSDYVLFKPPVKPRTWLLWAAPVLLVLGGGIAAAVVISRKSKLPDTDPSDPGLGAS